MKTTPMQHQLSALTALAGRKSYALLMEQGTGKSKVILDDAARLFQSGEVAQLIVVAPNGVHLNWVHNEIPAHLDVPHMTLPWTGTVSKRFLRRLNDLRNGVACLRVFALNIEALRGSYMASLLEDLLKEAPTMLVVDESTRIKNPKAQATKKLLTLAPLAPYRRILNGTPVTQSPADLYSQLLFLSKDAVTVKSFLAWQHRYCEFLPPNHPLVLHAAKRSRWTPNIQARDADGNPVHKNLDELRTLLDYWGFRVLKSECLDLPSKIYKRYPVVLGKDHLRNLLEGLARIKSGAVAEPMNALQKMAAYQRLLHGVWPSSITGKPHERMGCENSRIQALLQALEDHPGQAIIWARFTTDIEDIVDAIGRDNCVTYYGEVPGQERQEAIRRFQDGEVRYFVGNQAAGGVGITLTAAQTVVYYSNTFRLYDRLQSEDRAHRIGQVRHVVYIDLEVERSLDTKIINALRAKKDVADLITGDPGAGWLDYDGALT